jgi:osmotically-inducible protein OsmY
MTPEQSHDLRDIELAASIAAALHFTVSGDSQIIVAVSNAVVTLEGEARCAKDRDGAESLVRGFKGVAGVINAVTLMPGPASRVPKPRGSVSDPQALE